ncbi:MAG TPA: recombinase family protein [Propionibacteriaceae bacterium]|nr:recombinase family protein [Propionibacteriaceae bacterium]
MSRNTHGVLCTPVTGSAAKGTPYVALYLRISRDKAGRLEGVGRQEKWGRGYATRMWPGLPIRAFSDNHLSAFDADVERPQYEALRAAIRKGEVAHLWSKEQDRLEANRRRWVDLAIDLDDAGIHEIHTDRDGIVRLDEVADIKNVLSHHVRKRLRDRVNDTLRDLAEAGRPPGGRSFGHQKGRDAEGRATLEVVPAEADAIRWAAPAVLAGWSATAVANELESRGVPTAKGGKWSHSNVRAMLTNPRVAGFRVYRGEVLRRGNWEAILDEPTWRQLCAVLGGAHSVAATDGSTRKVSSRPRAARRYLLTGGIAVCGRPGCGAALTGRRKSGRSGARPVYACFTKDGGCNRLGINAEPLERHVRDLLFEWLDTEEFAASFGSDDHIAMRADLATQIRDVNSRRVRLSKRWSSREIEDDEWDEARADLMAQRDALTARLAAVPPPSKFDPKQLPLDWEYMLLDERRAVIRRHVHAVTVLPAKPGARAFDPGRVRVRFVGQAD